MDELFKQLEARIRALLIKCDQLEHANLNLKQNKSILNREKELLLAKNKAAIAQIEGMISRLKSIETAQ